MNNGMGHITFYLNGVRVVSASERHADLLSVLRDEFGLTGAKRGCGEGRCGTCTVLLDGSPVNACQLPLERVAGMHVVTIEDTRDELVRRVQAAFIAVSAPQCGYCTPAMVLRARALLEVNPKPGEEEIRRALSPVLCRCTGYRQYVQAVMLASGQCTLEEIDRDMTITQRETDAGFPASTRVVGCSSKRHAADELVNGQARYSDDYRLEGMCFVAAAVSPWPHARIIGIDTTPIRERPGVIAVFTANDIPGKNSYGKVIRDREALCATIVRCAGDPVAIVVAETEEIARRGAADLPVEWEPLVPILDVASALDPAASSLHPDGNIIATQTIKKGDIAGFFDGSSRIFEATYRTDRVDQAPLETACSLAYRDEEGILTIIAPTQHVFFDRLNVARVLGLNAEQVRIIQPFVGGAFGKREDIHTQILAGLACLLTDRPVKFRFTRAECFSWTTKRHPFDVTLRTVCDANGVLKAQHATILADGGAYASWSKNVLRKAAVHCCGPYELDNVRVDATVVYTNNPVSGAMRGFGAPQVAFAMESHLDMIADSLGISPLEIRQRNMLRRGNRTITGQELPTDIAALDILTEVRQELSRSFPGVHGLDRPRRPELKSVEGTHQARGFGMASIHYGIGFGAGIQDTGKATLDMLDDGLVVVKTGAVDYGQGATTIFRQLVAEVLGLPEEQILVVPADTHRTPNSGSTVASRQTYMTGNAVMAAAMNLRATIIDLAAGRFMVDPKTIVLDREGVHVHEKPDTLSWSELCSIATRQSEGLSAVGEFRGHAATTRLHSEDGQGDAYWPYTFGTHCAEVAVDLTTGRVSVLNMIAAHYIGKAINPRMVKGQILGAISQGLGFALSEHIEVRGGVVTTRSFHDYHLFRAREMPAVRIILLEDTESQGPFGAVGIGEPPLVPVAPAIANAVFDAVGYRAESLPLRADRILEFIRRREGERR